MVLGTVPQEQAFPSGLDLFSFFVYVPLAILFERHPDHCRYFCVWLRLVV